MESDTKTLYGVLIGLVQNKRVYLSRRLKVQLYPGKWQLINGHIRTGEEQSADASVRIVERDTGLKLDRNRFHYVHSVFIKEINEFYYVHLVHLKEDETPVSTENTVVSALKSFKIADAVVLDVIPSVRSILKRLNASLVVYESKMKRLEKYGERISQK